MVNIWHGSQNSRSKKKVLSKHWLISVKEYAAIFNPVKVNLIPSLFIHIFWTLLSGWSLILPQLPNDHSAMSITDKRQVRHSSRLKRWQQLPSSEEGPCRFQDVGLIFDGNRLSNNSWYPPWPMLCSIEASGVPVFDGAIPTNGSVQLNEVNRPSNSHVIDDVF